MEATDLMIKDWVEVILKSEKHFAQVQMIDGYGDNATSNECVCDAIYYSIDELKPIPLTTEILEKNGFKGEGYLILDLDEFSHLEYYPFEGRLRKIWHGIDEWDNHSDTKDITFQCHCKYVHELQHALRLCGLNELANNFKI